MPNFALIGKEGWYRNARNSKFVQMFRRFLRVGLALICFSYVNPKEAPGGHIAHGTSPGPPPPYCNVGLKNVSSAMFS